MAFLDLIQRGITTVREQHETQLLIWKEIDGGRYAGLASAMPNTSMAASVAYEPVGANCRGWGADRPLHLHHRLSAQDFALVG